MAKLPLNGLHITLRMKRGKKRYSFRTEHDLSMFLQGVVAVHGKDVQSYNVGGVESTDISADNETTANLSTNPPPLSSFERLKRYNEARKQRQAEAAKPKQKAALPIVDLTPPADDSEERTKG